MFFSRCILTFLLLNLARQSICKPTENTNYITEGRGIGGTIWGWITYPFSWWSSSEPAPVNDQLIGSTTLGPYVDVEVERHNVTVWCNEQTCTTMRCDKFGCKNTTCSIYDTDLKGECREYVTKPDEPVSSKPVPSSSTAPEVTEATQSPPNKPDIETTAPEIKPPTKPTETISTTKPQVTEASQKPDIKPDISPNAPEIRPVIVTNAPETSQAVDERPLELEAVLSSTVTEANTKNPQAERVNSSTSKQ